MPTRVELPRELCKSIIENAIGLRQRQIKAATNNLVKEALEHESKALTDAKNSLTDIK